MRKNVKATLYGLFKTFYINVKDPLLTYYVIDGGFLIHRLKWHLNELFSDILQKYVKHILHYYGTNVCVVFDGYKKMSIKSVERSRQSIHASSDEIFFNETMHLKTSQEKFLGNSTNKAKLIDMLREKLQTAGILTFQCEGDADRTIVSTAISKAETLSKRVVIIAEDTDILVLVTALTPDNLDIYMKKPQVARSLKKYILRRVYHIKILI